MSRDTSPRRPSPPFVPLASGIALLVISAAALQRGVWGGDGRGGGVVLFAITIGLALIVVGVVRWRPWFARERR